MVSGEVNADQILVAGGSPAPEARIVIKDGGCSKEKKKKRVRLLGHDE